MEQSNARKRSIFISVLSFEHKMQFNQNHFVLVAGSVRGHELLVKGGAGLEVDCKAA